MPQAHSISILSNQKIKPIYEKAIQKGGDTEQKHNVFGISTVGLTR